MNAPHREEKKTSCSIPNSFKTQIYLAVGESKNDKAYGFFLGNCGIDAGYGMVSLVRGSTAWGFHERHEKCEGQNLLIITKKRDITLL